MNCTFETDPKQRIMHIWIEPADWEGPERPIVQLDVRLRHYLGREKVSGSEAVGSRNSGCKSPPPLPLPSLRLPLPLLSPAAC